jgi:hypothetical protein
MALHRWTGTISREADFLTLAFLCDWKNPQRV